VSGIFFKLARCGYTLRVTSQASYIKMSASYRLNRSIKRSIYRAVI
jgi:hypothetical protein